MKMDPKKAAAFLRELRQFELCKVIEQIWKQQSFSYLDQPRPDFGLLLLTKGTLQYEMDHEVLALSEGDIVFLPKGSFYKAIIDTSQGVVCDYLINFDTVMGDLSFDRPIKLLQGASHALCEQFRALAAKVRADGCDTLRARGLFCLLLDGILQQQTEAETGRRRFLEEAKARLLERENLPIARIAKQCCISESSLRRAFLQETGLSPAAFRLAARLREAEYLLESTDLTVGEIADRLNFFDAAYFCKCFRAHTGVTPRQYARSKKM